VTDFADRLKARISAEGSIGLDDYMAACNDHYYATRDPLGAAGDFTTAPEISQMFGELVGAALADVWLRAGAPGEAIFAELGPGRGTLAVDALRVLRSGGFVGGVELVEASPTLLAVQKERLPDTVHREIGGLSEAPLLLVANEFLDALPIRQTVGGRERRVVIAGDGLGFDIAGEIRETAPARDEAVRQVAEHLVRHGGAALIVDYGYREGAPGDSFQAVRGHHYVDPFADPGEQDLTAHVDFGEVARVAVEAGALVTPVVAQGTFLERLGIAARAMALAAKNPARGEEVVAARRRLCDGAEMGELFKVIAIYAPDWPEPAGFRG
jgi:NADH dehydrogenase [ubiquinone] 1 alpha subcomplex assembly factor 7